MALLLGCCAFLSTLLGGLFALQRQDKLHLILGFSAGAVIGVAFFDLLPEALELGTKQYATQTVTMVVAAGFLLYMLLNRSLLLHAHDPEDAAPPSWLGVGSLATHSFLDGVAIGLAFKASASVGAVVAMAVVAHDFSDGVNTVGMVLKSTGERRRALRWLLVDAAAPPIGVASTWFFSVREAQLGLVLALFCGFFLFIGASDLLPESHHRHPKIVTSVMTLLGATLVYVAIRYARL
jgi:ZIP family zinc transporter